MKKMYKNIIEIIMLLTLAFIVLIYRTTTKFKNYAIYIALFITMLTYIGGIQVANDMYQSQVYAFAINNTIEKDKEVIEDEENIVVIPYTPVILTQIEMPATRGISTYRNFNTAKIEEPEEEVEEEEVMDAWEDNIGNDIIETETGSLVKCPMPNDYGDNINIASFKPYMDYRLITNTRSAAYRVSHSELAYTDANGFRRFHLTDNDFIYEGDDYVIALGSAFTKGGIEGQRFLIVGEHGMYTAKIGDHKSDLHTDSKNMYSLHGANKQYGGLIEFVVNSTTLESSIKNSGSINTSSVQELTGDIVAIYRIDDNIN